MKSAEAKQIARLVADELKDIVDRRWIKLNAAAAYSAIGKTRLKQLARDRKIIGYPDPENKRGDWIFDKHSLDEYRIDQSGRRIVRQKSLAILKSIQ
jgi:hypothetical protein